MSYTVSEREREMAVRSALGAQRSDLLRLVFHNALRIIAAGVAMGLLASAIVTRGLRSFLFGLDPSDHATHAAVVALVVTIALTACYRPARVAAAADPMVTLRR